MACSSFLLEGDGVGLFRDLRQALLLFLHLLQQSLQLSLRQALQPFLQQKRQTHGDQFLFCSASRCENSEAAKQLLYCAENRDGANAVQPP